MAEQSLATVGEYISLRQLPVIDERLRELKDKWLQKAADAKSLAATDENLKEVKALRADMRKEYAEVDSVFKQIKKVYMGPWEELEKTYRECVKGPFEEADAAYKGAVDDITAERVKKLKKDLFKYFEEYRESLGLDSKIADPNKSGIKVNSSDTLASLKKRAKEFLDGIDSDLRMIDTLEDRDEIMVEYRESLNVSDAVTKVNARHKAAEELRIAREQEEAERAEAEAARLAAEALASDGINTDVSDVEEEAEVLTPPIAEAIPEEQPAVQTASDKVYFTAFRVSGTIEMLKELKAFLVNGGYQFESIE